MGALQAKDFAISYPVFWAFIVMYICAQESLGRLMLHTSLVVNTVKLYRSILHDLLREGKVRALNEKPHQHLLKTEGCSVTSVLTGSFCHPFTKPTGQIKLKSRGFSDSSSSTAPHSCTSSSYLAKLFHKS